MATQVFSEAELERLRGFPEVDREQLVRFFRLTRYGWAMSRVAGTAGIAFAPLGLAATLLRRGALRRCSPASWLLSIGAAVPVAPVGWFAVSTILWVGPRRGRRRLLTGASAVDRQVGRGRGPSEALASRLLAAGAA